MYTVFSPLFELFNIQDVQYRYRSKASTCTVEGPWIKTFGTTPKNHRAFLLLPAQLQHFDVNPDIAVALEVMLSKVKVGGLHNTAWIQNK